MLYHSDYVRPRTVGETYRLAKERRIFCYDKFTSLPLLSTDLEVRVKDLQYDSWVDRQARKDFPLMYSVFIGYVPIVWWSEDDGWQSHSPLSFVPNKTALMTVKPTPITADTINSHIKIASVLVGIAPKETLTHRERITAGI